jgi:predicted amidohydrolase YtcJ
LSGRKRSGKSSLRGRRRRKRSESKPKSLSPTCVFLNGNTLTLNQSRPLAEGVAVAGARIVAVGSNKEIKSLIEQTTRVIDLKGATILPGFVDCHIHLIEYGLSLRNIDLRGVPSIVEMKRRVAERAQGSTAWILGRGWDQERFAERRYPTRQDLDDAASEKPVLLRRVCGHICVVNSVTLVQAGITAETPDPPGGIIDRDSTGEPTGILRENAVDLADRAIPPLTLEDYEHATVAASQLAVEAGLTAVHCITNSELELKALLKLKSEGRITLRFYVFIPVEQLKAAASLGLRSGFGDEFVRIGGVKIFADGSLGARTAALEAPYADDAENRGVLIYSQGKLDEIVAEAHRSDFQIALHAIGDRAISTALHAIAKACESTPKTDIRHRIEHASVLNTTLIQRMKEVGVVASVQPHFNVSDFWVGQRLGPERAALTYPLSSLLRAGLRVVGGSDCPVEPLTPLSGIEAAVNRPGVEAVTVEDAISFYTLSAAYASFDENVKGTIAPGKLADLVVLEKDPRTLPPSMISKIRVLMTMVGGRVVYQYSHPS